MEANTKPLTGRVALVTGASRGIGLAIARALAADGARVAFGARRPEALSQVETEMRAQGEEAMPVRLDVTDPAQIEDGVREVNKRWGAVHILVNNAGIAESAPLTKLEPELWERTLRTNLTGVYLCTRAVISGMIEQRWGRVINIASVAGKVGFRYVSHYSAAKHGVLGFTKSIALEVAQQGITVNAVCPSYVDSDMTTTAVSKISGLTKMSADDARRELERQNPQQRLISVEEVAFVTRMLCREEARGINGQAINICGGAAPY